MHSSRSFRWATGADSDTLADIMFDAVRNGQSRYSEEQRAAWVPARRSGPELDKRLQGQDVIIAEQDDEAVGFISLAEGGSVDFAYIRLRAPHTGLFRELVSRLAARAVEKGETRLWTHASLMAEPAFASVGFSGHDAGASLYREQALDRCEMEKSLTAR